jgi:hypothetical protein
MAVYYFAYGSNMDKERMKERKVEFTEMQKGSMKDWNKRRMNNGCWDESTIL